MNCLGICTLFYPMTDLCHIEEIDKKVGSIRGTVFVENVSSIYRGINAAPTSVCVMLGFGIDVEDGKIHIEMSIDQRSVERLVRA